MRLWHKSLIPVLPRQQLLGQWRELCLIAKNISEKGTPNHILVNPIMDYPLDHLVVYEFYVVDEMRKRGYEPDENKFFKWLPDRMYHYMSEEHLFNKWHTRKYLIQCLANLEEKHDRGGITDEEWRAIMKHANRRYA